MLIPLRSDQGGHNYGPFALSPRATLRLMTSHQLGVPLAQPRERYAHPRSVAPSFSPRRR
jgi:hypothetical protein